MATENEMFGELESLANHARFEAEGSFAPSIHRLAELHRERSGRLEAARARLSQNNGAEDAHLRDLAARVAAAGSIGDTLSTLATRLKRRPIPGPENWLVTGRLLSADGRPAPDLRVRVFDRDRKLDDLLGETMTDEFGDFSVLYHERDFAEQGEDQPDLYVSVEDAAGRLLFTSRDSIRFEAGRVEVFEITLPAAPPLA